MYLLDLRDIRQESNFFQAERHRDVACNTHLHYSMEIVCVTEGTVVMEVSGKIRTINAGQGTLVLPYEPHSFETPEGSSCFVILFSPELMDDFYTSIRNKMPGQAVCGLSPWTLEMCDKNLPVAGSLRKGEILALTWDDVDFQKGTITVSKTLKRVRRDAVDVLNGKDILHQFPAAFDEGRTVTVLKRPKTQSSIRTVYLPDYVLDVLRDWKRTLRPVKRKQPDLVLRYSNGRPLSEETLPRLLEKQLLQLGLPVVSFHSLRHSSISYKLVLTGGNIKAVQGDSGHAQAEMITERYGHVIDSCRKQCAQNFEEEFYKGM